MDHKPRIPSFTPPEIQVNFLHKQKKKKDANQVTDFSIRNVHNNYPACHFPKKKIYANKSKSTFDIFIAYM